MQAVKTSYSCNLTYLAPVGVFAGCQNFKLLRLTLLGVVLASIADYLGAYLEVLVRR